MLEKMTLTPEQEAAVAKMAASPTGSSLNASLMSAGKTVQAVELMKRLGVKFVLIIAPLNTHTGWMRTLERQGVTLHVRKIDSTKPGKAALADYGWGVEGIYLIGPELFARWSWNRIPVLNTDGTQKLDDKGKPEFKVERSDTFAQVHDMVIFDEHHRGANRKSKTHKSIMGVKAKYRHSMSGTIAGNTAEGLWAPNRWLFPDHVHRSYWAWLYEYLATEYDHFAPQNKKVIGEKVPGKFFSDLPCVVKIEPRIDVDVDFEEVYVELSAPQKKQYAELERDLVTWIKENPLVIEFPVTLRARLRQATLGTLTIDEDNVVTFPDDCRSTKLDALYETLDDEFDGESALIGCDSQRFVRLTTKRLNERYGAGTAVEWSGKTSQKEREQIKQDWIDGKVKYVVAVIAAMAEGVDGIQFATRNIVLLNRSDNRIMVEQFIARVHRTGQTKLVRVRELIGVGTYDEGVLSNQIRAALEMNKTLRVA